MRVVLRNVENGSFYLASGSWTASSDLAEDFGNPTRAVEAARALALNNVEVVFAPKGGCWHTIVPPGVVRQDAYASGHRTSAGSG